MRKILMILLCFVFLCGCGGNKSSSELIDIEQFKCQDSIKNVFNVLGEVELKTTSFDLEYYEYENLNLWGYNGNAIFSVRGDKETIQEFYCHLKLNTKEFEELLSYFSNKYGSYKVSDFGETIKTYKWEIEEEKAEIIGYNDIHIQYNGDKKYTVYFNDDMSLKNDDAYNEYLEEKNESEEQSNIIFSKKYEIDGKEFSISLLEKNSKFSVNVFGDTETENKACEAIAGFYTGFNIGGFEEYSIMVNVDDIYVTLIKTKENQQILGKNRDGSITFSAPDWFTLETDLPNDEYQSFHNEILSAINDFFENIS